MTDWNPGDRAMVVIDRTHYAYDAWFIEGSEAPVIAAALHPLPPALSAGDAAVLRLADEMASECGSGRFNMGLVERFYAAVRARAAAPAEGEKAPHEPPQSYIDGIVHASLNWRPRSVIVGDGSWQLKEAIDAYRTAPATDAPDPSLHGDGDDREAEAVDREDERERMVVAARERVVEAALGWRSKNSENASIWRAFPPTMMLAVAIDALNDILTPPAPDPVEQDMNIAEKVLTNAGYRLLAGRLRAALAALAQERSS